MAIKPETAARYHAAGLSVLPAIKAKKRPAIGSWKKWSERLPTDLEVEVWFSNGHDGVCIVAGAVSGNLECIDFDCKAEAYPAWAQKVDAALLNTLVIEKTPSGGKHVLYRSEGKIQGNQKLAQGVRNDKLSTLIETRGEAGLFLCAPTPGYELEQGDFEHLPLISAEARESLLSAARELNEHVADLKPQSPTRGESGAFLTRPGDDFANRGDMRPILLSHGWQFSGHNPDGNELWTRPGKDPRLGHSATLKGGVFFPFSSNASPFEPGRGYNAYQVYALLEHNNDFKAATAALLEKGYGSKEDPCAGVDLSGLLSDCRADGNTQSAPVEEDDTDEPKEDIADPGPIPHELCEIPGFVAELQGYMMRTAPYPNKALAFAGAFAMLAHLSGRKFIDEFGTRPNVYVLSLAASGTGKQHPRSVNVSLAALKGFATEMGDYFASGEGLEDSFLKSPTLFWQVDECDTLFNTMQMKDSRAEMISSMLLRLYSESSSAHIMRAKALQRGQAPSSTCIIQPHLTFLGTAVPKFFYQALSERTMSNGLLARCLVLEAGERGRGNDNCVSEEFPERVLEDVTHLIRIGHEDTLFNEFPKPRVVQMEADARLYLKEIRAEADDLYAKFEKSGNECALSLWARATEKVMKYALVYAISQNVKDPVIKKEAYVWAKKIVFHGTWRMLYQAGIYTYNDEFDRLTKRVLQNVRRHKGRLSYRNLLRVMRLRREDLKSVLETMLARGDLNVEKGPKGGDVFVAK